MAFRFIVALAPLLAIGCGQRPSAVEKAPDPAPPPAAPIPADPPPSPPTAAAAEPTPAPPSAKKKKIRAARGSTADVASGIADASGAPKAHAGLATTGSAVGANDDFEGVRPPSRTPRTKRKMSDDEPYGSRVSPAARAPNEENPWDNAE